MSPTDFIKSCTLARKKVYDSVMGRKHIPFAYAHSIYEIDVSFFQKLGVKFILSDLDNTLDPYIVQTPTDSAIELVKNLDAAGIKLIVVSNNSGTRVHRYAELLGVDAECFMKKPFSGPLKKMMKRRGIDPNEAIMIGDQIMTDVIASNGAGVRCILTEPLCDKEPPWTKWNRLFDKPKRKKMAKLGLLKDWRSYL